MKPSKSPWYPWFPRDYGADEPVGLMTLEQEGAYRRLLDHQWLHGSIPSDLDKLAVLCKKVSTARMRAIWKGIGCCFDQVPGEPTRLINARLERVRIEAEQHRDRQKRNGSKGAEKRWQKDGGANGGAIVSPMAKNSSAPAPALPQTTTASAVVGTTATARGWSEFDREVPADYRSAVEGALRSAGDPDALRRELVALREGITGSAAYTVPQITRALHELAVAGSRVTSAGLRAFCRRIAAGDRETTTTTDASSAWAESLKGAA